MVEMDCVKENVYSSVEVQVAMVHSKQEDEPGYACLP
jgi:hypothetical protein